jgi:LCP family protein required for cell wall assembly
MIILVSAFLSVAIILVVTMLITPANIHIPVPGNNGKEITFQMNVRPPGEKVILMMGVDLNYNGKDRYNPEGTRTDTMMLIRLNSEKKTVSIVSIPRDSKVYLAENKGVDKVNAAHALGGPELAVQTVQDSFGIPIDNYMVVNFQGVHEVVDALGGVDVYVEKAMHYRDRTAKLNIDFEPGLHHLDGKGAEEFLRFRHDALADIGRIRRQQQFISALTKRMKDPLILTRIPALITLGYKYIQTDIPTDDMLKMAYFMKDINMDNVRVATLPGHPSGGSISYWIIDPEPAQKVLDRLILDNAFSNTNPTPGEKTPMKVGILYSAQLKDLLPSIVSSLEQQGGFTVSCQSTQSHLTTQIVEHSQRVSDQQTQNLRSSYRGLGNARLIFAPVGTTFENNSCSASEDYTVMLGDDLRG